MKLSLSSYLDAWKKYHFNFLMTLLLVNNCFHKNHVLTDYINIPQLYLLVKSR